MKLFRSRTSDVMVFSDEIYATDLVDFTGEVIYKDEEGDTYYIEDAQLHEVYVEYCNQHNLIANQAHILKGYMGKVKE